MAKTLYASVAVDTGIDKPLDYRIPDLLHAQIRPGTRVCIPVRGALQKGTVLAIKEESPYPAALMIASLLKEETSLPSDLMPLAEWISRYYAAPLRRVLRAFLPPVIRKEGKHKTQLWVRPLITGKELIATCANLRRSTVQQAKIIDILLKSPKGLLLTTLLETTHLSKSPVDQLAKKKILTLEPVNIDRAALLNVEYFPTEHKTLNLEQQIALDKIKQSQIEHRFETHLLHGVTGSGKTEVYLQAIQQALDLGKGAILLVPEIALTSQIVEKLKGRFKEKVALLHHKLSEGEKHDAWLHIKNRVVPIVIGARSAIFSPIPNLGLIIVDEEHEASYKQTDEAPCYHARDVAIVRAKLSNATIVLGSATPSLESYYNSQKGKYTLSTLLQRADSASLPRITIVDMQREFEKKKGFALFSDPLLSAIQKRLSLGEQTLLFLNRRGYHTAQMCLQCSHTIECPDCDVSLTYHLGENVLACHLCGYKLSPPPRSCPSCHSENTFKYKGAGTEMVERALHALFPELRTLRLDADTTRHKGSHEQLFKQFRAGKADLLIGTQMVAKGLHFPSVTLVGVLNADAPLSIPDFRASEQTFQLLTQVAGRAGRGTLQGEVFIQTQMPEHPIIRAAAAQDYDTFYKQEIESRNLFDYPPFTKLMKIILSGVSLEETQDTIEQIRLLCIHNLPQEFQVHPAIPCGHAKVKARHRFQFLIKGSKRVPPLDFLSLLPLKKHQKLLIDIDPLSTFF